MVFRIDLTDDELQRATEMRFGGMAISAIATALGLPDHRVRKVLDPAYALRRELHNAKRSYVGVHRNRSRVDAGLNQTDRDARKDAERLRQMIPPDTRGLTARIAGDPLPGRSALDQQGTP